MKSIIPILSATLAISACSPTPNTSSSTSKPNPPTVPDVTITTGFIRLPQIAYIDRSKSYISISDSLDLEIAWLQGASKDTITVPKAFKGQGWFVHIESPAKIWIFDGGRHLDFITPSGRYSVTSPGSDCPKAVWDALPADSRMFLQGHMSAEQGAAANP